MNTSIEKLEGRLIAQRKVLAMILAALPETEGVWRQLDRQKTFQGQEEDPGVIPDSAFAIEATVAEEFRLIAEEAVIYRSRQTDI
jgi:hypothetical protein